MIYEITSLVLASLVVITGFSIMYHYHDMMNFKWRNIKDVILLKLPVRLFLSIHLSTLCGSLYILLWISKFINGNLQLYSDMYFFQSLINNAEFLAILLFHRHVWQSLTYDVKKRDIKDGIHN